MPSWPDIFQFGAFSSVVQKGFKFIFPFGPSSNPYNSFFMVLVHSDFLLCFLRSHIWLLNRFAAFAPSC